MFPSRTLLIYRPGPPLSDWEIMSEAPQRRRKQHNPLSAAPLVIPQSMQHTFPSGEPSNPRPRSKRPKTLQDRIDYRITYRARACSPCRDRKKKCRHKLPSSQASTPMDQNQIMSPRQFTGHPRLEHPQGPEPMADPPGIPPPGHPDKAGDWNVLASSVR